MQLASKFEVGFLRLILAAAVLHIIVVIGIFLAGYYKIFPSTFDSNGIGISFAIDSQSYRTEAEDLAESLRHGRLTEWQSNPRLHVKLYSLFFLLCGPILGRNILSLEPVNLTFYLLVIALVYSLGKTIFDQRVGLIAGGAAAVWPSFLLYSTQMLRDPLFIALMLLLLLIFTLSLMEDFSWRQGLAAGLTSALAILFLWLIRGDWWELIFLILGLGIAVVVVRQLLERKFRRGNALAMTIILAASLALPKMVATYRQSETSPAQSTQRPQRINQSQESTIDGGSVWLRAPRRLGILRGKFIRQYPLAGSNMDTGVALNSLEDIIRYAPRAIVIGLFAPFPNMWFSKGAQVGRVGRLLSGVETFLLYIFEALAVVCTIRNRRHFPVWLLVATVIVGVTALGYVVVNLSALYRMRYVFGMLCLILGSRGLLEIYPPRMTKSLPE